jgi:hypothetical protein
MPSVSLTGSRQAVLMAIAAACILSPVLTGLSVPQRWVPGPLREAIFLAWSESCVVAVGLATWLDGGAGSPMSVAFAVPLVFSALSYPLSSARIVARLGRDRLSLPRSRNPVSRRRWASSGRRSPASP